MTRFTVGDRVRVLDLAKKGHVRIPHYIRHHAGHVTQYCGTYLNPEDLAVGNTSGRAVDLYRVSFAQSQLWPEDAIPSQDTLIIEIYDHWLAPAQETDDAP